MYISETTIKEIEEKYGSPEVVHLAYEMKQHEFEFLKSTMKDERAHDITLFIIKEGKVVVISKHSYPPGAYRAPSGGLRQGEPFEEGAIREAYEETGLNVQLQRYVLRAHVKFSHREEYVNWTTHVFTAVPVSGTLEPIDKREIAQVRLATDQELNNSIKQVLLSSGSTGLRYRSELNDLVMPKIRAELGAVSSDA